MAHEPPAADVVLECIALGVHFRQELALALEPCGITPEQHEVLSLIAAGKSAAGEICAATGRDKTTVSRILSRATRAGLVEQARPADDRRKRVLQLTDRGATTVTQAQRVLERTAPKLLGPLSVKDRRRLDKVIRRLGS